MRADLSEPTAEAPNVPEFTLEEIGERLGDVLGRGTTSVVYSLKGFPNLAVKEILLDGLDRISVDAIKLELATVPGLAHPGILKYHQIIEDKGLVYIVMDRRDKTLERLISEYKRKRIPVPVELVLSILRQIIAALAYLHSVSDADAGRPVRCDLRPANVLVSEDGENFVIADFGLRKDALRSGSTLAGTRPYMASETLVRNKTSPASDVWSLGVILYELTTLKRPDFLEGREPAEVFVDGWKPDLSGVTDGFMRHVLEKIFVLDPAERPTARELSELLRASDASPRELMVLISALSDNCKALTADLDALKEALTHKNEALEETIAALRGDLEAKTAKITTLEGQCREHLAATKALEAKVMQLSDATPQSELLLLPKLIRAAHTNDVETVRMLLEEGVRAGQRDTQGMTALMHAAWQGHVDSVKLLVEKEKGIKDKSGWTALMHAAYNNHPEVVKIIAPHEHGKRNNNSRTALMIAAEEGSLEIVGALVEHEKGLKDKDGSTAFMYALKNKHTGIAALLREHEASSWTPLMCASFTGDIEAVKKHLSEKNKKNNNGETALVIAAREGHKDIVELLDPTDENGFTALMRAADRDDVEAVQALLPLQGGMKMTGCVKIANWDINKGTALMVAAARGHTDCVRLLVEKEGGMSKSDGWTALMLAASSGHIDCARLLVKKEKDAMDNSGYTALAYAKRHNHPTIVFLLSE